MNKNLTLSFLIFFFSCTSFCYGEVDVQNAILIKSKEQISSSSISGYFTVTLHNAEVHVNRSAITAVEFYDKKSIIFLSGPAYGFVAGASAIAIPNNVMSKQQVLNLVKGSSSWW
jgi:hypothetical protein